MFGMVNSYTFLILYFVIILLAIFYPEILRNPQISTVYLWISLGYIVKSVDFS